MNGPAILLVFFVIATVISIIGGFFGRHIYKSKSKNGNIGFVVGFLATAVIIFLISFFSK